MTAWLREDDERQVLGLHLISFTIISKLSNRVSLDDEILCTESSFSPRSPWSLNRINSPPSVPSISIPS